jgi:cobalt-zinc-cadmium efflux system protein
MHDHSHSHAHGSDPRASSLKALGVAIAVTGTLLVVQAVGGILAHSLALLSDAAHMLTDLFGLGLSYTAARLALRPSSRRRTYGLYRIEILAAVVNGVLLLALAVWILWEAVERMRAPRPVGTGWMLVAATLALGGNLVSLAVLKRRGGPGLNMRAARLEIFADTLGSAGVLVAALVILPTGWTVLDPILSAVLALAIVPRTLKLLWEALHILLEGTPPGLDHAAIESEIQGVPGVLSVHDLHVWCLTSGVPVLTAHVVGADDGSCDDLLDRISGRLAERFAIDHATIQIEHVERAVRENAPF